MSDAWQYSIQHPEKLAGWALEHIWVVFVASVVAIIIGVALGLYVSGRGKEHIADIVLYPAEILMCVPSLALFGLLMLILAPMGLSCIGFLPAALALIAYAQLPILRNTYAGIRGIDPAIIEAGKGMGMSERQILFKIKLRLAVPVIMAGLRTAIVLTIGIATIAVFIGYGGFGEPIYRGIRNIRTDLILVGGISVSILAILLDALMNRVEYWTTPKGLRR